MTNEQTRGSTGDSSLRIIVVEDGSLVAMMIEDILTDLSQVVATSGRMPDASELVSSVSADLGILDVNLNDEETYLLAERLAARETPFVFAMGYGSGGVKVEWSGVSLLQKPFHTGELAAAISSAMTAS